MTHGREQANLADLLTSIGDGPTVTEQETALERARETWALSRPDANRDRDPREGTPDDD